MVGPQDGGFGFDQSKKYTSVDNLEESLCSVSSRSTQKMFEESKTTRSL